MMAGVGAPTTDLTCYSSVCPITNGNQILAGFDINTSELSQYYGMPIINILPFTCC